MPIQARPPALFVLPHHDDEIFIATTLRQLAHRGDVSVAWLTRGGLHGDRREFESRRAMELLGVSRERLYFFRLPDGRAIDYLPELVVRLKRLIGRLEPASVFVPEFEGGHIDHDTAQLAAAAAIRRLGIGLSARDGALPQPVPGPPPTLYEFPLYNRFATSLLSVGRFIPGGAQMQITPMKLSDRLMRRKLVLTYPSQRWLLWPLMALRGGPMMLHISGEPYRRVLPDRDYTHRPHHGRLAYEFYTTRRFAAFAAAAEAVMR